MANDAAKRILIVDDDLAYRRLLTMTLKSNYALEEAGYGKEALERIVAFKPGLVLLDIVMPGIDGHETCRRIKASWPMIRVMMVSARSSSQEQLRAFEAGADDYVVKPFDPQDICADPAALPVAGGDGQRRGDSQRDRVPQPAAAAGGPAAYPGHDRAAGHRRVHPGQSGGIARPGNRRPPGANARRTRRSWPRNSRAASLMPSRSTGGSWKTSTAQALCTTSARWASPTASCSSRGR